MNHVREFHEAFGLPILGGGPTIPSIQRVELRRRLVKEEWQETDAEFSRILTYMRAQRYTEASLVYDHIAALAKELADLRYVVWGTDLEFGFPSDAVDLAVHQSNMSKLGSDGRVIRRRDGKVMKGPDYYEADVLTALGILEGSTTP